MLYPLFAMVFLTFFVMLTTFITRVKLAKAGEVKMDFFKLFQGEEHPRVRVTSRHYTNIFEVPVLFYTASVLAITLKIDCNVLPIVAWSFVGFRVLHSVIHLTYNKVPHRVMAFLASNVCVFTMWAIIAYENM